MKTLVRPCLALLCGLFVLGSGVARAADAPSQSAAKSSPGLEAAQAISTITGVAISPLLGVSAVGAWQWFKCAPEKRARLSWYAQPWFWGPAMFLVLLTFLKDTFGAALPTTVKKPFDVAETIENKISGLVAAGMFVPLIAAIFKATGDDSAWLNDSGVAMVSLTPLLNLLTIPLALAAFVVVWMVSHVIHVLILISPFTIVDTALKSFRLFLLSTVTLTSFANPYVGAAWALVIIVICAFLAGWAFRLFVFGTVFTWDLCTFRQTRFKLEPDANWVFTAREIGEAPIRSYGRLTRGPQGELTLIYRPWLVLPRRTLVLPSGNYAVGRGLFYSEVIHVPHEAETVSTLTLPPRYRRQEQEMSSVYMLKGVQDAGVVKGVKSLWRGLKDLFGSGGTPATTASVH
jgi:hypothetical protein